ncbi:MAG: ABC transporter ATP-binding protein [Methylacidiphilales bacterium]|nr:ABC transporter ATP-binding protein [Candidatus Methylacidiphilales bacterium]NJR15202.1 ABC transporter ATP-binding protein [Calothrix sp. CSU_2_0]
MLIHLKVPYPIRGFLKASKFWQDNYLILREFKHFRKITTFAIVFTFCAAVFEGIGIGLLIPFLQSLTSPNTAAQNTGIVGQISTFFLGENAPANHHLYFRSILILLSTWTRAGFTYLSGLYIEQCEVILADRLRKQLFEQLQSLPLSYFTESRSGELVNTMTTEIERLKQGFGATAFVITRLLVILVYFVSMFCISWQLTIISVFVFSPIALGLTTLNRRVREASFGISDANSLLNSNAFEFINAIRTVHAFGTQEIERQRFYTSSNKLLGASIKVASAYALVKPVADCIVMTVLISLIIISLTQFTIPVYSLLGFFFVLFRTAPILPEVNGVIAHINTLAGSLENIKALLRTDDKKYFENGKLKFTNLKHSIDLVSVDFGYDRKQLVLHNVKLTIERGKMTALVGQSGSGKSTLADLIARFYDPTEGQIFVDGVDLRMFDINTFRSKLAVVSQDTFIFNASVRDNIAYGKFDATDKEIREAAKLANALEFIQDMPEGFDTRLGERGVNLSGGQRQRIAIARALIRNPEILILDEATAALDTVSERLIQESIENISVGRTIIAIAHRLSTVAKADKVVVLENGYIVEQGRHEDLLELRGKFWKYYQLQQESGLKG